MMMTTDGGMTATRHDACATAHSLPGSLDTVFPSGHTWTSAGQTMPLESAHGGKSHSLPGSLDTIFPLGHTWTSAGQTMPLESAHGGKSHPLPGSLDTVFPSGHT